MMQGVSAGSRMLFRNAFKNVANKALAKSSELTAKTIGTKAVVSIGYQTITQKGEVNLITVIGDSFFSPYVGAALGNMVSIKVDVLEERMVEYDTIFKKDTKVIISAIAKSLIAGTLGRYGGNNPKVDTVLFDTGMEVIIKSNENVFIQSIGKIIEQ